MYYLYMIYIFIIVKKNRVAISELIIYYTPFFAAFDGLLAHFRELAYLDNSKIKTYRIIHTYLKSTPILET